MRSRTTRTFRFSGPPRGRRGSTFLLVLSVLALAILISITLTYVARLDVLSSRNFVDSVGARVAVTSGLQSAPPFLARFQLVTARTQLWARPLGALPADDPNVLFLEDRLEREASGGGLGRGANAPRTRGEASRPLAPGQKRTAAESAAIASGTASASLGAPPPMLRDLSVQDLSGRLNINAAGSWFACSEGLEGAGRGMAVHELMLERSIARMLKDAGLDPSLAKAVALDICDWRLGADKAPGVAGADDNANSSDARPGSDGIDNDRDGEIDNVEEEAMAISLAEAEIAWMAESKRRMGADAPQGPLCALENNRLDDWGLGLDEDDAVEGIDDPAERFMDPRERASGDDLLFSSVEWLRALPSVTDEIFEAIAPHATVFSVSRNAVLVNDEAMPRLNLNRVELEAIVERLRAVYGEVLDDRLIVQFACNVADRRDPDHVRSRFETLGGETVLGLERVPFLTEVYPNARTLAEDGDDGQFVEIHNPWDEEIVLDGWTLEAGGRPFPLTGKTIPAGGWLIVTDDIDDRNDPDKDQDSAQRMGSFFAIFNKVASPPSRQILEAPGFSLPDRSGVVRLLDRRGDLADAFEYQNRNDEGTTLSHQRPHPALAASTLALATPFALPKGATSDQLDDFFRSERRRDSMFASPGELLGVSSAWAKSGPDLSADTYDQASAPVLDASDVRLWQWPSFGETAGDNIGADVTDLFYVGPPSETAAEHRTGLINLNTASAAVLLALPGMTEELAEAILKHREKIERQAEKEGSGLLPPIPFPRPSAVMTNDALWPASMDRAGRAEAFAKMSNLISVSSSAFEIASILLERDPSGKSLVRQRALKGVVALDDPSGGRLLTCETLR